MYTFRTHSGTEYHVSKENMFWGGPIKVPTPIVMADVTVGCRAEICLQNGQMVSTSAVKEIRCGMNGQNVGFLRV